MNRMYKLLGACGLFILSNIAFASTNPIQWSVTRSFPKNIAPSDKTHVASYTFTNMIPFTMGSPLFIQTAATPTSEFTFVDSCSGKKLRYLESCTFTASLKPETGGTKTLQLTGRYGYDQVNLPAMTSVASSQGVVTGAVTTPLPSTLAINEAAPWKFTFTNNTGATISGITLSISGAEFSETCGQSLSDASPNNTCEVSGSFTPVTPGVQSVAARFSYTQGPGVQLTTSTLVSGATQALACEAAVPFAPQILVRTTHPVTLLCTNLSDETITINSRTATYPQGGLEGDFVIDAGGDNCSGSLLSKAQCQLKGVYTAPTATRNDVSIALTVNYQTSSTMGLSAGASTTTDVVQTINNARTIHLQNQCDFPVWWSMVGGAITDSPACTSDSDCPSGSRCNVGAKLCYYVNYPATVGSYKLDASGGTNTTASTRIIQTDASTSSDDILWKGLISASTGCSGVSCANNPCGNSGGTASCAVGVGFEQPSTVAEFTFKLTGSQNVDSYDISNVNGFSVPMSMATNQTASNYNCGNAGNTSNAGNLKACTYNNITPPTNMYYWVSLTDVACTSQNTCTDSTKICGLAFDNTQNDFKKNCGSFLGFWQANQICQTNPAFSSPFGDSFTCGKVLGHPFPANQYTLTELLKCSPPNSAGPLFNSCYLSYSGFSSVARQQCCGCTNWSGIATPSAACPTGQVDPEWTNNVEGLVRWMKEACPTSYVYPYDDKASSFVCTASEATEYTITFCPSGKTGLPIGKTDGRL